MDAIKHAAATVKEKLTGHHGHDHKHDANDKTPGADKARHKPQAPVAATHPDPPTHGHAHYKGPPGAPGIIETPASGVVATGTQGYGLQSPYLPRI